MSRRTVLPGESLAGPFPSPAKKIAAAVARSGRRYARTSRRPALDHLLYGTGRQPAPPLPPKPTRRE